MCVNLRVRRAQTAPRFFQPANHPVRPPTTTIGLGLGLLALGLVLMGCVTTLSTEFFGELRTLREGAVWIAIGMVGGL